MAAPSRPPARAAGEDDPASRRWNPHRRTSRFRFRSPPVAWLLVATVVASALLAPLAFLPGGPSQSPAYLSPYTSSFLFFAVPLFLGTLLLAGVAPALGGHLPLRRAALVGLFTSFFLAGFLVAWRLTWWAGLRLALADLLVVAYAQVLWFQEMVLCAMSHRSHARSLPGALVIPGLGILLTFLWIGTTLPLLVLTPIFLLLAVLATDTVLRGADRPLRREFGTGGTDLLKPLMEHMNSREKSALPPLERFFTSISSPSDLRVGVLGFRREGKVRVALVAPSVHPGPFAELGSSDLPSKLAQALRPSSAESVLVPHSPSTHDQDLPSREQVDRLLAGTRACLQGLRYGPVEASPLVSPGPESLVRAQALGDGVLLLISQAPKPSDDIGYAVAELLRREATSLGFDHAIILDAHNSFVENQGNAPFGSPEASRMVEDARAAMALALAQRRPTSVRVGVAQKRGYTPKEDGIAAEGLSVLVLEAAGSKTAYALFDANNLLQGMREPLVRVLRGLGLEGDVMTTDNHVVHEVSGGLNTLGARRELEALSQDLHDTARAALADLQAVEVGSASVRLESIRVLGPGTTERLMTALGDSFLIFAVTAVALFALSTVVDLWLLSWVH